MLGSVGGRYRATGLILSQEGLRVDHICHGCCFFFEVIGQIPWFLIYGEKEGKRLVVFKIISKVSFVSWKLLVYS